MIDPLDRPPADAAAAATDLRHLAEVAQRAALLRLARRLLAVALWADAIASADNLVGAPPAPAAPPAPDVVDVTDLRPRNQDEERAAKILALVASEPRSIMAIAKALRSDRLVLKQVVRRMTRAGQLRAIGTGRGRQYTVPLRTVKRPAPAAKGRGAALDPTVHARDVAIIAALNRAGAAGLSATELATQMPAEGHTPELAADALGKALSRLRIKEEIVCGEGGRWRLP